MLQSRGGSKGEYVLIIAEIDNFNEINARYGFSEGEFVISCVSGILSKSIRDDDFLSHQYCERYVLLVKNVHKDPTGAIAKRFIKALDELNSTLKKPYTISFSWGFAQANIDNDFEKAYNEAEQNLLLNKQKLLPRG
jgi:diguanylate cyclase (GGDEF)-like protein